MSFRMTNENDFDHYNYDANVCLSCKRGSIKSILHCGHFCFLSQEKTKGKIRDSCPYLLEHTLCLEN